MEDVVKNAKKKAIKKTDPLTNIEDEVLKDSTMAQYIFDEKRVLRKTCFVMDRLNKETFYLGQLLPKEVDLTDKSGKVVGKEQKWMPVLITSSHDIVEVNKTIESKYGIKIAETPHELPLACRLATIRGWLKDEASQVNGKELFKKVRDRYEKFLFFLNERWYDVHSLWDMGTWFFNIFSALPILELRSSLPETAKSKVMKTSRLMTFNPSKILINPSEASLFRETHSKRYTKYIDEAEKIFRFNYKSKTMEQDNRAELLNGSYSKGSTVPRSEKVGNRFVVMSYDVYSPTMIASIGGLHGATESRAITHIMTKARDSDARGEMEIEQYENDKEWQDIRDEMFLFVLQNWKRVSEEYQNLAPSEDIKKRDFQLWRPLLSIAKTIDEELYERVEKFASEVSKRKREDVVKEGTLDFKIIQVLRELVEEEEGDIYVSALVERYKTVYGDDVGQGFNRRVSARLDNLGFKDFREKHGQKGSYFTITKDVFDTVVSPILSSTSSTSSTASSIDSEKEKKKVDDRQTKLTKIQRKKVDEVDEVEGVDDCFETRGMIFTTTDCLRIMQEMDCKNKPATTKQILTKAATEEQELRKVLALMKKYGRVREISPELWMLL